MNFYEDEFLEEKLDELSDQMGVLVIDLLTLSLKKLARENGIYSEIMHAKLDASSKNQPF
jgi:hypothetical protein